MRPKYCLLDLDGVLADFVSAACERHNVKNPYHTSADCHGTFDIARALSIKDDAFWRPLSSHKFWAEEIQPHSDADRILDLAIQFFEFPNIGICSSPSLSPWSVSGKMSWVSQNLPTFRRRVIITPAKHFLAHSNVVLIDDRDENITRFREAGGHAILLPRPWNSQHLEQDYALDFLHRDLSRLGESR